MRSRCRCSLSPAIRISSRGWPRSSSTDEPSDPPSRVFKRFCFGFYRFGFARVVSPGQALVCARSWRKEGGKGNCEDRRRARIERTSTAAAKLKCGATVVSLSTSTTEMVRRGSRPQTGRSPSIVRRAVDGDSSRAATEANKAASATTQLTQWAIAHLSSRGTLSITVKVTDGYGVVVPFSLGSSGSHLYVRPASRQEHGVPLLAIRSPGFCIWCFFGRNGTTVMILPQVHLRKPCYDFYFL